MMPVHRWGRFEGVLESARSYEHPVHELDVKVEFRSPSGRCDTVRAFWDGGRSWRVRYCPDEPGLWQARTLDASGDSGLARWRASFRCVSYQGNNPLYEHGAVRVAGNGRHLEHADGTPFFLLADTTWAGPMRSTPMEWDLYLADRATKRFSAVLFLPTQFRACAGTRDGRRAYAGRDPFRIDPAFYGHIDDRVDSMNDAGLLGMPLLLHAGADTTLNVGHDLGPDEATLLARYMVARYGAHHVLWDFVAESSFQGDQAERWRQVGRRVFDIGITHPVTLHPYGRRWVLDEFRNETWMDVLGYQSAHNDDDGHWQWILHGPPSTDWRQNPPRPLINLEPPLRGSCGASERSPLRRLSRPPGFLLEPSGQPARRSRVRRPRGLGLG